MAQAVLGHFGQVIAVNSEIRSALEFPSALVLPAFSREFLQPGAPPAGLAELRADASPLFCAMVAPRPEYGEEILLQAFAQVRAVLPAAKLALYGIGSERHARGMAFPEGRGPRPESRGLAGPEVRGLAGPEARGLAGPEARSPAVHGFGELPRPQALALISSCDVFVRPTLADGDSVSVREALAFGSAVVATQVGNRPAEVKLVAPGDADALAKGLLEAAGEISFRPSRMASAPAADSLDRILMLYGWQQPAAQAPEEEAPCAASAAS
jgi:hypothetical protein